MTARQVHCHDAPEYILAASRILGHSDIATTLGHYEQSSMPAAGATRHDHGRATKAGISRCGTLNEDITLPFFDLEEVLI